MKLLLLHGPAITSSRKKLLEIKGKFDPENVVIFEKDSDTSQIMDSLKTVPMFSEEQLIILENPPENLNYTQHPIPYTLVLWFDHEISEKKPIMEWVKKSNGQILYFPESKEISIFPFLDYLGNRDKKAFLEMDNLKKAPLRQGFAGQGSDTQYIITMIFYLLRNLIYTPKTAKDFIKQKNARMRTNFSQEELVDLYEFVLDSDFKIKSGLLDEKVAEFLLVNLFCH